MFPMCIFYQSISLVSKYYNNHSKLTFFPDPDPKYKDDNFCLLMLLKGMCLKGMKSPLQAQECFEKVLEFNGKLKGDKHLIPYTMYEFSLLVRDEGRLEAALAMMEKAK